MMEDRFDQLARSRARAFSPAESEKILEAMLPLGSFEQLASLYTNSFSPLDRKKILAVLLRIGNYEQLEKLHENLVSPTDSEKILNAMVALSRNAPSPGSGNSGALMGKKNDLFIMHAAEDEEFAAPLALALRVKGLAVNANDFIIQPGDWLQHELKRGLTESRYGLLVLSQHFFNKLWPQREAEGLAAKEQLADKVILAVLHNYDVKGVASYSPTLAARIIADSNSGAEEIAKLIFEAIKTNPP